MKREVSQERKVIFPEILGEMIKAYYKEGGCNKPKREVDKHKLYLKSLICRFYLWNEGVGRIKGDS